MVGARIALSPSRWHRHRRDLRLFERRQHRWTHRSLTDSKVYVLAYKTESSALRSSWSVIRFRHLSIHTLDDIDNLKATLIGVLYFHCILMHPPNQFLCSIRAGRYHINTRHTTIYFALSAYHTLRWVPSEGNPSLADAIDETMTLMSTEQRALAFDTTMYLLLLLRSLQNMDGFMA